MPILASESLLRENKKKSGDKRKGKPSVLSLIGKPQLLIIIWHTAGVGIAGVDIPWGWYIDPELQI